MLSHQDYTVGWVCALPFEMAAAKAMLDDIHTDLPNHSTDRNTYTLGRIGIHNIVVACLPFGVYGTTTAATVASQMMASFDSIRFSLMVGIGGGVSSKSADIRLGDVVVSKPTITFGGVVQYDYGKTVTNGHFVRAGVLNKPPQELLTAISKLQADKMMKASRIATFPSEMLVKYPEMNTKFTHRGQQQDRLFQSEYDHIDSSDECDNCSTDKLVARSIRSTNEPYVHYGLIASGNRVIKHGGTRDLLAQEFGILCFEMEAAGLMDNLPCLIIRGICDYADSHKNDHWQEYAAGTAAAYAKELLLMVPAKQFAKVSKAVDVYVSALGADTQEHLRSLESVIQKAARATSNSQDTAPKSEQSLPPIWPELHSILTEVIATRSTAEMTHLAAPNAQCAAEQTQIQMHGFHALFESFLIAQSQSRNISPSDLQTSVALAQKPSYLCEQLDYQKSVSTPGSTLLFRKHHERPRPCSCPMEVKRRNFAAKGPFWVFSETKQNHLRSCKYFSKPDWAIKAGVTLATTTILKALQLSFYATRGAGGFSFTPNFAVTRIVDRRVSPAFRVFDKIVCDLSRERPMSQILGLENGYRLYARRTGSREFTYFILNWDMVGAERRLKYALSELQSLFESGRASAIDTDIEGRTLLHEVTILSGLIDFPSPSLIILIEELVRLLIQYGVVRDARCRSLRHPLLDCLKYADEFKEADAMEIGLRARVASDRAKLGNIQSSINADRSTHYRIPIDEILSSHSCELFDANLGTQFYFYYGHLNPYAAVDLLYCVTGSAQVMGYGPIATAVVNRSLGELEMLLQSGHDPNEDNFDGPNVNVSRQHPLRLALRWPVGFRALLRAGADRIVAIGDAIRFSDDTAMRILIEYDCPMSLPIPSVLGKTPIAMLGECHLTQALIDLAIAKLVDQRSRFWSLVQQILSPFEISELGILLQQGQVLDHGCGILQKALTDRGVYLPLAIRVSSAEYCTVYHSCKSMKPEFAQRLFDAGFKDVDHSIPNSHCSLFYKLTPFLIACLEGNYKLADWFLERGARGRVYVEEVPWIAQLHVASTFAYRHFRFGDFRQSNLLQNLKRCNGPFESDECACYCSLDGCTPITALHGTLSSNIYCQNTWSAKVFHLRSWLDWGKFDAVETCLIWEAFCRLEIFTRLGMAHTCCNVRPYFAPRRIMASDERSELQDEDNKAGFVSKLNYFMDEYKNLGANHPGPLDKFLVSWWSYLDGILNYNETWKENLGSCPIMHKCPEKYLDCDSGVFLMTLDELREFCYENGEGSS